MSPVRFAGSRIRSILIALGGQVPVWFCFAFICRRCLSMKNESVDLRKTWWNTTQVKFEGYMLGRPPRKVLFWPSEVQAQLHKFLETEGSAGRPLRVTPRPAASVTLGVSIGTFPVTAVPDPPFVGVCSPEGGCLFSLWTQRAQPSSQSEVGRSWASENGGWALRGQGGRGVPALLGVPAPVRLQH